MNDDDLVAVLLNSCQKQHIRSKQVVLMAVRSNETRLGISSVTVTA